MIQKIFLHITLIAALMLTLCIPVYADVTSTSESHGKAGAVYVAGNPDFYPIEYYDEKQECYRGVVPELLSDISKASGVDFVYINAGIKDQRKTLAENKQAELLSACILDEAMPGRAGAPLLSVTVDGKTCSVGFYYTEIASEELQTLIEDYAGSLSAEEMTRRVTAFAAENGQQSLPRWIWMTICGLLVLLTAITLWSLLRMKRKTRANETDRQTDPGTGAWNRHYFLQQFSLLVTENTRPLCYLIYFHFNIGRVNEYYGEEEAENLLRYTVDELNRRTAAPDFFARVSGGGFASLRQYTSRAQAESWTQETLDTLNLHTMKFGRDYNPEFHAGIYALQPDISCEMSLFAADQGCRQAEQENVPYVICEDGLLRAKQENERLRHDAIRAIENHEFQCYMQFIARADTGMVYGAELLSRWNHPEMGLQMPNKYISDMENSGTIVELDFYMFEEACRILARLGREEEPPLKLFCNFSRKTVSLPDFYERLHRIEQRYQFDHRFLCLEITESSMVESEDNAIEGIRLCRDSGFLIALDDVGSCYSSFSDLANFPIDIAKLDRSLLLGASNKNGYHLLQGINALFHSIQVKTLCEGVETPEQSHMVQTLGIDLLQGFYIQRALPVNEALKWLQEKKGRVAKVHRQSAPASRKNVTLPELLYRRLGAGKKKP